MSVLLSILGWAGTKALSLLGSGALETVLKHLDKRQEEGTARLGKYTEAFRDSLDAEVQTRRIASGERIALWSSPVYQGLICLIVVPPAMYVAMVLGDSMFHFSFDIDAAPARFEELSFNILLTFIGASGAIGAFSSLKGIWKR